MHTPFKLCLALGTLASIIPSSLATDSPATKDSTILRSTVSCPSCPELNCYKCTLGNDNTIKASTGGMSYVRALVGFKLSDPVADITSCSVQFPAFVRLLESPVTVTVARALSSDWDEGTVTAENAPEAGDVFTQVTVPALSNLPALDVTEACQAAQTDGQFSIYLGTQFDSIEIYSKNSGNPAILHVKTA
ncbi:uncharacterized protein ACLA_078580 [Aspergillus clavatus NRRL 1]|uniref:Carbohydrate-binding module family 96 domain-containing protein n=1 Tax=Aspergillus clavatus (strain ATCC 1007 / CBS 513.65 / DSM 816 / NCTC 3887 / NRRL 1 / QM 1276 / 107) TaxID=344612 RepID=A1CLY0_ASPCL|nr:uncharacterized protein ACLA_078580 [Aspergillus clavatus NRRL 1]EAW09109.1 conserved hypothetical protein [Aspergillus clavatus NRRL 1]